MDKGDTFLMGAPKAKKKHLWVVLSDTNKHSGSGIIVNISTDEVRSSAECPIIKNEHPWLDAPTSWVCYGDAVLMHPDGWVHIRSGIACGMIIQERKASDAFVEKLIAGAKVSASKENGAFRKDYLPYLD